MFLKRYLGIFAVYYIPINTVYTFGMNREFCLQRFSFVHNWMLDLKIQVHRYIRKLSATCIWGISWRVRWKQSMNGFWGVIFYHCRVRCLYIVCWYFL